MIFTITDSGIILNSAGPWWIPYTSHLDWDNSLGTDTVVVSY